MADHLTEAERQLRDGAAALAADFMKIQGYEPIGRVVLGLCAIIDRFKVDEDRLSVARELGQIKNVEQAIRDYHFALDDRQPCEIAAGLALAKISKVLDMIWYPGEEKQRRDGEVKNG